MAKITDNSVFDAFLDKIATSTTMSLCSAQPANYAGIAAVKLADAAMVGGDYTNADGDTNGRKVTIAAQAGEAVDGTGSGNHVVLDDGVTMLYVTTCDAISVTAAGTVDFPAWDIEVADPV